MHTTYTVNIIYIVIRFRSFYDHPTFFVVINFGSELEVVDIQTARPTLPDILKVKISSTNSGYVTG